MAERAEYMRLEVQGSRQLAETKKRKIYVASG